MGLLDTILSTLNGAGGMPPDAMPMNMGGFPGEQPPASFPPGGVPPMPRPRPPEADFAMKSTPITEFQSAPAAMPQDDGSMPLGAPMNLSGSPDMSGRGGGLAAALGLNPDIARRLSAGLAGGLKGMNGPFAGDAIGRGFGGSLEGVDKSDQEDFKNKLGALDRALKMKQIDQRSDRDADLADYRFGNLDINKQKADQTGTYQNGRLALGATQNGIRQQNADTGQQRVDQNGQLIPSRIALNEGRTGLANARTEDIKDGGNPSVRLGRADAGVERWYKTTSANLRDEMTRVQSSPMKFAEKEAELNKLRGQMATLTQQYEQRLVANRKAHGFNADGTPVEGSKGRASASRMKQSMGTNDDPWEPTTADDFALVKPGHVFRDPGDGKLYVKE